jgi:hypothetical protein
MGDGPAADDAAEAAPDAASDGDAGGALLGDERIEPNVAVYEPGVIAAYSTVALQDTSIKALNLYVDGPDPPALVLMGLYTATSEGAYPGDWLGEVQLRPSGDAGAWYSAALDTPIDVAAPQVYWFEVMSLPGDRPLRVHDQGDGGTPSAYTYDPPQCTALTGPTGGCQALFLTDFSAAPLSAYGSP